jgi:hypothetical protein
MQRAGSLFYSSGLAGIELPETEEERAILEAVENPMPTHYNT